MAEIKTIYKGESITLLFTFPALYDMARLTTQKVFVGETEFAGVKDGQTVKMQLKSSDTDRMIGTHKVVLWMNDTTLGLRKPYCGELVVAKTQAAGNTVSVSNISDIIIPIVISETAVTVGDILYNYVKGDKGDPFTYADFTPENIAELQQPATDAIASIEAVELSVEQAEALRVQAEQTRQTNTGTAIQNAETATTNAGNAASLANEVAGLADTKATLADQKATLANDAANLANTKAGLADTAATNANNVANTYAAELALKELKANKQNSLAVDGTGVKFLTVDAVNGNIASQAEAEANTNNTKFMTPLRVFQNYVKNIGNYVNSSLNTTSKTVLGAINELFANKANKAQEAWITPTLLNGWLNYSQVVQYRKNQFGVVEFMGLLKSGTIGSIAFTLPVGYRPNEHISVVSNGISSSAYVRINSAGDVYIFGANSAIAICQITFNAIG